MSALEPVSLPAQPNPSAEGNLREIQAKLQKLEQRDWWLWSMAVIVMLLLTFAVFTMSFPDLIKVEDPFFKSSLNRAVRGLIGLVLIFNGYTIYQQVMVKRLRREFSRKIEEMRILQARAEEFERLAQIDPLTGLSNRRAAEDRLASEAGRSQRHGNALTVVSFDLDKFKRINDTYGHLAGDQVLKEFAVRLSSALRLSDFAARMGGDEFSGLAPEMHDEPRRHAFGQAAAHGDGIQRTKDSHPIFCGLGWIQARRNHRTISRARRPDSLRREARRQNPRSRACGCP